MISTDRMHQAERSALLPLMLLANFAVFQYLLLLFHKRWREPYVLLLLFTATLGWVSLVPFASVDTEHLQAMNDVSEGSLALLLLVETTLVGSSSLQPSAVPSLEETQERSDTACVVKSVNESSRRTTASRSAGSLLMRGGRLLANALIIVELALLVLDVALIFCDLPPADEHRLDVVNGAMENLSLAFTFIYRFGLLSIAQKRGLAQLLHDEWLEILFHVIFATHEYPFMVLENSTGAAWEYVQGLYMRLTLFPCIWMTIGNHHYHPPVPSVGAIRRLSQVHR